MQWGWASKPNCTTRQRSQGNWYGDILEPLITLGLSNPTPSVIKDCRIFCSNIADVAYLLNAEIKARWIQPQIFWPISSDSFDDDCFEGYLGSSLQIVQLALSFGIKDHASGPSTFKVTGVWNRSCAVVRQLPIAASLDIRCILCHLPLLTHFEFTICCSVLVMCHCTFLLSWSQRRPCSSCESYAMCTCAIRLLSSDLLHVFPSFYMRHLSFQNPCWV